MNLNVDNCPSCGMVFQKNIRHMCNACYAKIDRALDRCIDHLWKYPNSTADELSAAVQISVTAIYKFIKEGKLSKSYSQLSYPCECCGVFIRENRLCTGCSRTFKETAKQLQTSLTRTAGHVYNIHK